MPQVINTNVMSLNAQRNLNASGSRLATSLERLSSGMRINSAKDDAAGLAIANRMTAQINGLNQAARNASDGISLSQTAEGDLGAITKGLQRIRELAVQSANATNSASDRAALQQEVSQLIAEMDRTAVASAFNGVQLLDGTFTSQQFQVGANAGQTIDVASIASARTADLGQSDTASFTAGTAVTADLNAGDLTINGNDVGAVSGDASLIAAAITATSPAVTATATNVQNVTFGDITATTQPTGGSVTTTGGISVTDYSGGAAVNFTVDGNAVVLDSDLTNLAGITTEIQADLDATAGAGVYSVTDDGTDISITKVDTSDNAAPVLAAGAGPTEAEFTGAASTAGIDGATNYTLSIDGTSLDFSTVDNDGTVTAAEVAGLVNALTGYTASEAGGVIAITKADASNIVAVEGGADANGDLNGTLRGTVNNITSQAEALVIGGNTVASAGLTAGTTALSGTLGGTTIADTDISTVNGANAAIMSVDAALDTINSSRASLGAIQSRFESVVGALQTTAENLSAARSRIQDADFAAETAALTKDQILQQAGISILSQANAQPQLVLSLLQ